MPDRLRDNLKGRYWLPTHSIELTTSISHIGKRARREMLSDYLKNWTQAMNESRAGPTARKNTTIDSYESYLNRSIVVFTGC